MKIESKNDKPKNLNFKIEGKDKKYNSLEEMENELQGQITKNKSIIIDWEWKYENNTNENMQDTKDGENLKKYNFTIYVTGK